MIKIDNVTGDVTFTPVYRLGATVYHRGGTYARGVVIGYSVTYDSVLYRVSWGTTADSLHYYQELATERPVYGDGDDANAWKEQP